MRLSRTFQLSQLSCDKVLTKYFILYIYISYLFQQKIDSILIQC